MLRSTGFEACKPAIHFSLIPAPNKGTRSENVYADIYWSHTVDIIPNWLSLVAGWTWIYTPSSSVANAWLVAYSAP